MANKAIVGIIMGSDSDLPVMEKAFSVLNDFKIPFEVKILSAHRTPEEHSNYSKTAASRGLKVIIAAAGMAAHLPGVTAGQTVLPVIGVPMKSSFQDGLDSLLSIVQMPPGIPVATVTVGGSKNAALLAVQIIATGEPILQKKFEDYKIQMAKESMRKNDNINLS